MKRRLHAVALTFQAGFAGSAIAQGSVVAYGIVDQSLRFTSNANASNDSLFQLANGAITNSRFGLKGEESLGGGVRALFRLEGGFDPDDGTLNQGGRIFGRYAYVGLADARLGTITLGRQGTEAFNFFGEFDPLTVGNYKENAWPLFMTVGRIDNVVSYAGRFGAMGLGTSYGFGEQAGSASKGSYWGGRGSFDTGGLSFGGTFQEMRDASGRAQRMWGVAGRYALGGAKLFAGYIGGRDASGFVDSALNAPNRIVEGGSASARPRRDTTLFAGATYPATPQITVTGAFYFNDASQINGIARNGGKRYTGVLLAEYALSARTQLYGTVDLNCATGGAQAELPGKSCQTGLGAGIRHVF